eukprot:gb/GFBE01034108.1/.p1 GENE.gb/GFBE01034108.1/~~gb/GFBE01034108.1/.p1  ORF type:complete len:405 (+),score=53.08 gb/GFBE01034108.1/:1-1215(+)
MLAFAVITTWVGHASLARAAEAQPSTPVARGNNASDDACDDVAAVQLSRAEGDSGSRRPPLADSLAESLRAPLRRGSAGCNNNGSFPGSPGGTENFRVSFNGTGYDHKLSLPSGYTGNQNEPLPLLMYFHGWGGSSNECGGRCSTQAPSNGFAAIALQGIGPRRWASWKGFGSTESPGPRGATCEASASDNCYKDCGECADNCWWTTCQDSVAQAVAVLDSLEESLCLDLDQIWAAGCSNGAMFLHELAKDPRTAGRLAGIAGMVGSVHRGFNTGPTATMSYLSMLGNRDRTVPPFTGSHQSNGLEDEPDITVDTQNRRGGWYFHTAEAVSSVWADRLSCDPARTPTTEWGLDRFSGSINCIKHSSCRQAHVDVVECVFNGGHICDRDFQWEPMFEFMKAHPKA